MKNLKTMQNMKNRTVIAVRNTAQSLLWLYAPLLILSLPLYLVGKLELLFKGTELEFIASVMFGQILETLNRHVGDNFWKFKNLMTFCFMVSITLSVISVADKNVSEYLVLGARETLVFQASITLCLIETFHFFWVNFITIKSH